MKYQVQTIRIGLDRKKVTADDIETTEVEAADMPSLRQKVADLCMYAKSQLYGIVGLDPQRFMNEGKTQPSIEGPAPLIVDPATGVAPVEEPETPTQPAIAPVQRVIKESEVRACPAKYSEFENGGIKFRVNLVNGQVEKFDFVKIEDMSDFKIMLDDQIVNNVVIYQRQWIVVKSA